MAVSMGKGRQPDRPEAEEQVQPRVRLRTRQQRTRQKLPLGQEVMYVPPPVPERIRRRHRVRLPNPALSEPMQPSPTPREGRRSLLGRNPAPRLERRDVVAQVLPPASPRLPRKRALMGTTNPRQVPAVPMPPRPKPAPINHLASQQTGARSPSFIRPNWRQLRLGFERGIDRPNLKTVREIPLSPKPETGRGERRNAGFEPRSPERVPPQTNTRPHVREPNRPPTAAPGVTAPVGTTGARRLGQNPAKAGSSRKSRTSRRPQKRPAGPLVHIVRLLIVGIGIGAIVGTLLSALNPADRASMKAADAPKTQIQEKSGGAIGTAPLLGREILPLKAQIQTLVAQNPTLQPGIFIADLDTGDYLDWNSDAIAAAASTIKLPILVAFFQDVDAGKIHLDEPLTLQSEMMAQGSGDLQYKQVGSQYTALEVATKMIAISDNTATNMLIARLGGAEGLNQRFRTWGLTKTAIRNPLPDVEGTNTSSPRDLSNLMSIVDRGQLVSLRSRDRLLDIMQKTETNTLLPKGLGAGATIAHKTGNIGSLLADVGLVDMPSGKRYLISVMVKRSHNDTSAEELIRQVSRTVYEYFNQPQTAPGRTSMPLEGTATIGRAIASGIDIG